jgi:hypothetical protein
MAYVSTWKSSQGGQFVHLFSISEVNNAQNDGQNDQTNDEMQESATGTVDHNHPKNSAGEEEFENGAGM